MTILSGNLLANITGGVFTESNVLIEYDVMSDSPASILATYLAQQLITTVPSTGSTWPLWVGSLPPGTNNAGAIYNTSPIKDGRHMSTGFVVKHYGVQVKIRSTNEENGWNKCNSIQGLFDTVHNVNITIGTTVYQIQNISQVSGIIPLGSEPGTVRRYLFTMNFLVTLKEV